jgi:hypothetical protein
MRFDAPFKLGPFLVDAEGRLAPREPGASPAFLFRWRERVVRARLDQTDDATGQLTLQVTLARVPSTAGAFDENVRPRSFVLLHWLERQIPSAWNLALLADHRVWLEACARISLPVTAAALLSEVTLFALNLTPYIDLMDEVGLTLPVA